MAENLNYKIANSWCYDNKKRNCSKYGRLYTWEAAKEACPSGWRLPTDEEWKEMAEYYGGCNNYGEGDGSAAYAALIEGGSSGFAALLGGDYGDDSDESNDSDFGRLGIDGHYWSDETRSQYRILKKQYSFSGTYKKLYEISVRTSLGLSCRCIQD